MPALSGPVTPVCDGSAPSGVRRLIDSTWFWAILAAMFGLLIAGLIIARGIDTDIQIHAWRAQTSHIEDGIRFDRFLFFGVIRAVTGSSHSLEVIEWTLVVLIGLAVAAKLVVSLRFLEAVTADGALGGVKRTSASYSRVVLGAIALLLLFTFSLPVSTWTGSYYLGQYPANVWHNTTTIFAMPFVVLLLWWSYRSLLNPSWRNLVIVLALALLTLGAKPNFLLCLLVVYPLFALIRFGLSKPFFRVVLIMAITLGVLVAQAYFTFVPNSIDSSAAGGGFKIDFLNVWSHYSRSIRISFLASYLFPLVVLALYWRSALSSMLYLYTWALSGVALLISMVFSETGVREYHGNLEWQVIMTTFTLFLVSVGVVLAASAGKRWNWRESVAGFVFLAHVASGVFYVARIFSTGSYA